LTLVSAGRVGRPHGYDGSFYVEARSIKADTRWLGQR
jgi:hypothetical protein